MSAPITDLDAERAMLVACLADRRSVARSLEIVVPDDLYDPMYRTIFTVMADMDGMVWDPVSVAREIRIRRGDSEASRAISLMVELVADASRGDVIGHAKAIANASRNRQIVDLLRQATLAAELRRPNEAIEILSGIDRIGRATEPVVSLQQLMLNAYETAKQPRSKSVLTWGHYQLDEMTGGLRPGFVAVIGAASSQGKSSEAIALVDENIKRGARAMIVSLEDGPLIYGNRFLARRSGVDAKSIRDHALVDSDHKILASVVEKSQDLPMFLHCEDMPWERVSIAMEQAMIRNAIDLVVLDYIQECACEKSYQSRQLELQAVARRFRAICRKRNRAGVILTQLTRPEKGKPPVKENARECQDIVNGAEQVLLLYTDNDGAKMANLDKAKDGSTGLVAMNWNSATASYENVTKIDEAMAWADERYDGFSASIDDLANTIGATDSK